MNHRHSIRALAALTMLASCSSTTNDAPLPVLTADASATVASQSGRIVDFRSKKPIAGATITAGGVTTTTGADGRYTLGVERGAAFAMSVAGPDHIKLIEQASLLDGDRDRGDTLLPSATDARFLQLALDDYDVSLGVLSVQILPVDGCAHVAGATVRVDATGARMAYFVDALPSFDAHEAKDDELPTVVVYNLPVGRNIVLAVDHPACALAPFPHEYGGIRYLADVKTEAGDVTSFARLFLQARSNE